MTLMLKEVAGPINARLGKLKQDENGYVNMVVGAIGTVNSRKQYYAKSKEVIGLFADSSVFQRMVKEGALYGENGHPDIEGLDQAVAMSRFMSIHEHHVCAHFNKVYLDDSLHRTSPTIESNEIAIVANVKPYGPHASVVQDAIDNPKQNLCFSIRCLAKTEEIDGKFIKTIIKPITFDKVYLPGIRHATKLNSSSNDILDRMALRTSLEQIDTVINTENIADAITVLEDAGASAENISWLKGLYKETQEEQKLKKVDYLRYEYKGVSHIFSQPWT